jgi:hypothetical protein
MDSQLTAPVVKDMKVLALRTELKNRGLSPSGLKSVLVRRLLRALKAEGVDVGEFSEEDEHLGVDHTEEESPSFIGRWRRLQVSSKFKGVRHATQRVVHIPELSQVWSLGDLQDSVVTYSSGTCPSFPATFLEAPCISHRIPSIFISSKNYFTPFLTCILEHFAASVCP